MPSTHVYRPRVVPNSLSKASLIAGCALAWACWKREPPREAAARETVAAASASAARQATAAAPRRTAAVTDEREVSFGDGRARFFVPADVKSAERLPLLLILHGLGGSGAAITRDLALDAFASRRRFVYVSPDGAVDPMGRRFWNAGRACCNFFGAKTDDVARLHQLVEHGVRALPIDPRRVFVVGYSNGGFMAHRLACERSQSLAAIVSIAAGGPQQACAGSEPVAVLEIHGDKDPIVPFAGGHLFGRSELPRIAGVQSSLEPWTERNRCGGGFRRSQGLDLVPDIAGSETDVLRPSQCAAAPLELWVVRGGSHYLAIGQGALEKIWDFLAQSADLSAP